MRPRRWLELTLPLPEEPEHLATVTEWLLDQGGVAVEERNGTLITYLPASSDPQSVVTGVRGILDELLPGQDPDLTWRWQDHGDWEDLWKKGLAPRRIAPRLVVSPSWVDVELLDGDQHIVLDPGMAFGTAEHATTRSCLRALTRFVRRDQRIADVGAGSGILSIAAALLGSREVLALEMDEASCKTAEENLTRNGVRDQVKVCHARLEEGQLLPGFPYDGVVANLQRHLIVPLLPSFVGSLVPDGWIILSGILMGQEEEILVSAGRSGLLFQEAEEEDGWWTAVFTSLKKNG